MSDELLNAIQTRDVDRLAALLAAGADPNEPGTSRYGGGKVQPLHAAIWELREYAGNDSRAPKPAGPIDSIVLLLRHGARVQGWDVDKQGDPLLMVVDMNHIEAARLFLAAGADPNVRDGEGTSPLRFCAQHGLLQSGLLEMARLLLQCGATKTIHEAGGGAGMNALGQAVYWLDVEMVRLLLAHGADPNVPDADRMTAFDHLRLTDPPEDPASQERLREIRQLLGEPRAEDASSGV